MFNFKKIVFILLLISFFGISQQSFAAPVDDFVTTWKTDNVGTSNDTSITIPTTGGGYNYDVDWNNDGVFDEFGLIGNVVHNFGVAGTYTIRIQGNFPRIYFNNAGDRRKILSVDQWGTQTWVSMSNAFYGCSNLDVLATDTPDLSSVNSLYATFFGASSLSQGLSSWNVSGITSMNYLFYNATSFNEDLSNWDVTGLSSMYFMFRGATSFDQDLSDWDVSGVSYMHSLFQGATSFDQDLSDWDISNVSTIYSFLTGVTLSTENYDALLNAWSLLTLQPNLSFDGGDSVYCTTTESARQHIIDTYNWTITDGGSFECPEPGPESVSKKKKSSSIRYGCKDIKASNYTRFVRHKQSLCEYKTILLVQTQETELKPFEEKQCPAELVIHNNMRYGDTNGIYSSYNKGIITQIVLLQKHINRFLVDKNIDIDIWFGSQTENGVEQLQTKLNELLEGQITPLIVDGIVGPKTRTAINMSC